MNNPWVLLAVLVVEILCAIFFVSQILISVLGIPLTPISWRYHELIEIGAAIGLITGVVLGALALRQARARSAAAEESLRVARSAFQDVLEERFAE